MVAGTFSRKSSSFPLCEGAELSTGVRHFISFQIKPVQYRRLSMRVARHQPLSGFPPAPRCYAVLGYGGNGITFSMLAAQLISASIGRRRDPDAGLFAFRSD